MLLFFLLLPAIPFVASVRFEAYWDSSYAIPPERNCQEKQELYENPIDIWKHVPDEFRMSNLTINIAFADFDLDRCEQRSYHCRELVCGLKLYEDADEDLFAQLVSSIKEVQESGALVKLSYGGLRYGNLRVPTKTTQVAERVVEGVVRSALALGVDGVDLVQKEGCGIRNLRCDDQTSIHLHLLEGIRKKLPKGKILSYSFPVFHGSDELDFPYIDVVKYGLGYLDSISLLGMPRSPSKTIQSLLDLGVPPSKIMWGFSKESCDEEETKTVETVKEIVSQARENGLAGVTMWNLNNRCKDFSLGESSDNDESSFFRALARLAGNIRGGEEK